MSRYLLLRLAQFIPILIGISFLCFVILSLVPGDPVELLITSNPNIKVEDIKRLKHIYGLDQPIYIRYVKWFWRTLHGDFGWSRTYKRPTIAIIAERLPNTLILLCTAFCISLLLAVPVGILSSIRQYSFFDYLVNLLSFAGVSMPVFWFGLMLIMFFSVKLNLLPAGGVMSVGNTSFLDKLQYLILPSIVLSITQVAEWTRYIRSSMLDVIRQDYVLTARAKGLSETTVIFKHTFRNALIPFVTLVALSIPGLFSGAVVTETIFSWPGMGRLILDSVLGNDYYLAMAAFMLLAFITIVFNLIADILYAVIDPRIRYNS